ncbi:MAG: hypothetical protein ABSD61_05905, partial [Terracidiphilus sp.]
DADKAAMRAQLSVQLNEILETRDSARGLIVSMSDVLFDTGQYSLKPGAREKLAKVATANTVSATGFGNSSPVASNDNSAGRQENRRVELVVSGEAIGSPVNATTGSLR